MALTTVTGSMITPSTTLSGDITVTGTMIMGSSFMRNRIINGDMRIDQRNAGAAVTINNGALFTVDRWLVEDGTTTGVLSVQQVSDAPAGYVNSLKVTASTGTGSIGASEYSVITQFIEGLNISDFAWGSSSAVPVMVSFWVKATTIGTYSCTLYNSALSRINPQSFTINAANTWEYKTVAFVGDTTGTWLTTNGRGIVFNIYTTIGTTYQSSSGWNGSSKFGVTGSTNAFVTTNNTFQITGVQLEIGTSATPFERRLYGQELLNCQRYYYQIGGDAPYQRMGNGLNYTTTNHLSLVPMMVSMRSNPTLGYSSTSHFAIWHASGTTTAVTGLALDTSTTVSYAIACTVASGLTSGGYGQLMANNNTSARLTFSAEL